MSTVTGVVTGFLFTLDWLKERTAATARRKRRAVEPGQ